MSTTQSNERRSASPGPERASTANLVDVARLGGVSPATASRVLAGRSKGKAASHDRVLAAADELGYVVNGLARSMMGVGRRSVAFVSAVMVGPTFATMAAAEQVVTEDGHMFMLCTTHGDVGRERAPDAVGLRPLEGVAIDDGAVPLTLPALSWSAVELVS